MDVMNHPPQWDMGMWCRPQDMTSREPRLGIPGPIKPSGDSDGQLGGRTLLSQPSYPQLDLAPCRPIENMFRERLRKDDESIAVPAVNSGS